MIRRRSAAAGLWAGAALLVGHGLAYRVVYPDAGQRHEVLEHSGHGWIGLLAPAAVLFAVGAAAATALAARGDQRGRRGAFTVHAAAQVGAYVGLEVGERLLHNHDLAALPGELIAHRGLALLAVGVLLQVLCAGGAALLARLIEQLLWQDPTAPPRPQRPALFFSASIVSCFAGHAIAPRGPPAPGQDGPIDPRVHRR